MYPPRFLPFLLYFVLVSSDRYGQNWRPVPVSGPFPERDGKRLPKVKSR